VVVVDVESEEREKSKEKKRKEKKPVRKRTKFAPSSSLRCSLFFMSSENHMNNYTNARTKTVSKRHEKTLVSREFFFLYRRGFLFRKKSSAESYGI